MARADLPSISPFLPFRPSFQVQPRPTTLHLSAVHFSLRPALMVYGGTIRAGCRVGRSEKLDIISAFQAYGEFIAGSKDDAERLDVVRNACPGSSVAIDVIGCMPSFLRLCF